MMFTSSEIVGTQLHVVVSPERSLSFALVFSKFEGRKKILDGNRFSFEPTGSNIRSIYLKYPDASGCLDGFLFKPDHETSEMGVEFSPRIEPSKWQKEFYEKSEGKRVFALFAEPGAGKTKAAIDKAFKLYAEGRIDAVLVVAKKDVHTQWIKDALPEHAPEGIAYSAFCHDYLPKTGYREGYLNWMAVNFDALKSNKTYAEVSRFVDLAHRVFVIFDESQEIKNKASKRWEHCFLIRKKCEYALIMSGTPIAKALTDYWAQYYMLDMNIIGDRYLTTFKTKYCKFGGFNGKDVIGYKNEKELYELTQSYTYRVSKKDLGHSPKLYKEFPFDMDPRQRKVFDDFKNTFTSGLGQQGGTVTVQNAGVMLLRLQQITSGFISNPDGTTTTLPNPRLHALQSAIEMYDAPKIIIWCRFKKDVENVLEFLGDGAVGYYGPVNQADREENKRRFIQDPTVKYFVATAATAGTGIDGLQKVCRTNIYYTNSFNSIHRWQSEDRTNRTGMAFDSTLYVDLICRAGIDRRLLKNLRGKKDLSDLMLDALREFYDAKQLAGTGCAIEQEEEEDYGFDEPNKTSDEVDRLPEEKIPGWDF